MALFGWGKSKEEEKKEEKPTAAAEQAESSGEGGAGMDVTKTLDCKGLTCPEPILRVKMAMNELSSGQVLEMLATDPGSVSDMSAWSKRTGNKILGSSEKEGVYQFFVQKG
ncbi:MAG: sulfurtransferase TusA family protein [Candidatus Nitrospinota bacterium M3_3B_026]